MKRLLILVALTIFAGCGARGQQKGFFDEEQPAAVVKTGLEVLIEQDFTPLKGKRVGLVTNPSGVNRNLVSTIDILANAPGVNLVALYGPEHGVRGSEHAGDKVSSEPRDPSTGLPVYSLYGATRKPTKEMLKGIDVMVYDIQDNGCRSYTFISTLGLVMSACAEAGIEVMVLDRPNPLGGLQVDGPLVEDGYFSFVGMYKIPYVYGLTVGELATMINEEGMNRGQKGTDKFVKCKLKVIEMEGWRRDMLYQHTGLPWVMPSPHIPQASSAQAYPCSGIAGEMGSSLNIGVGYTLPFELFGAEWIKDSEGLAARLNNLNLPGVRFRPVYYKPFYGGAAGKLLKGVQFYFTDYSIAPTALLQFYVMQELHAMYPGRSPKIGEDLKGSMLGKVMGGSTALRLFAKRYRVEDMLEFWNKDRDAYLEKARKYHRY
ncbi:MAG: DUF1343 domain-containing protein [Bacteroidales bacterium]|nr:DUF1343 domain-containing protein [Bacteroidales bacterium]